MERPTIGVLAIQGSFDLHLASLRRAGIAGAKVRSPEDLSKIQGLIVPGGESTVLTGITRECGLFGQIRDAAATGMPMFGTCAGAILLGEGPQDPERLGVVPASLVRNAYGRQSESFVKDLLLDPFEEPFHGIFIRAPRIGLPPRHEEKGLVVLGREGDDPVFLRYRRVLLTTFHPELTDDTRIHRYFVEEIVNHGMD